MIFKSGDLIGGRYKVLDLLGQGGVGMVYCVIDQERNSEVALKVLRPEVSKNRLALERFRREVKTMRQIDHGGITPIYDTGRIGESLFYTMECVKGESIRALIKREKRIDSSRATSMMIDICSIMEKVHEVAIHRDLSSDNIMVQPDGTVRILDFGTARIMEQDSDLTAVGMHLGKICYSAPEQRVDSRTVDHRADLYSLGILFFEMLTGELVIGYEPVTSHCPDLPPQYDTFFEKSLAEQPEDRYQTTVAFSAAIQELAGSDSE